MKKLDAKTERSLISEARRAAKKAYSPYSKVKVGAALLAEDGKVYSGCNVENASYGLTICAERTAVFKAVSDGVRSFKAVAVTSNLAGIAYPCGACRQVLMEFGPAMEVVLFNLNGEIRRYALRELLAHPFRL